jgi:hypothetical protein
MGTEVLIERSAVNTKKPLQELKSAEKLAAALESEELTDSGRKTLQKLQIKIANLEQSLQAINSPKEFSPEEAGNQAVLGLQNAEGGAWTGTELMKRFDLTPATLHRRRKEHRIIFWRDAKHDFHYPKWQFTEAGALLPGLEAVLRTFQSQDEWRVMRYFLGRREQLGGRRPLDLLRASNPDKVLAHAQAHGEENTW